MFLYAVTLGFWFLLKDVFVQYILIIYFHLQQFIQVFPTHITSCSFFLKKKNKLIKSKQANQKSCNWRLQSSSYAKLVPNPWAEESDKDVLLSRAEGSIVGLCGIYPLLKEESSLVRVGRLINLST